MMKNLISPRASTSPDENNPNQIKASHLRYAQNIGQLTKVYKSRTNDIKLPSIPSVKDLRMTAFKEPVEAKKLLDFRPLNEICHTQRNIQQIISSERKPGRNPTMPTKVYKMSHANADMKLRMNTTMKKLDNMSMNRVKTEYPYKTPQHSSMKFNFE